VNVIAGAALCFLAAEPALLSDPGFQLSFLAVALIAGIAVPALESTLEPVRLALRDIWNTDRDLHLAPAVAARRVAIRTWLEPLVTLSGLSRGWVTYPVIALLWLLVWAAELLWVSFVVQAGMALPLVIYFQRVSAAAMFLNLAVIPLVSLAVPAGLLAVLTGWQPAAFVSIWAAEAVARSVAWQAAHGPLDARIPPPPLWLGALFALCLVALAWSFGRRPLVRLASAAAFLASLALLLIHPFPPRLERGTLEMSAIDVGQGDALLVALPEGKMILVDAGGQPDFRDTEQAAPRRQLIDIGDAVVSPYLWSRSIQKLDAIAVTHPDADHLGGVPALLRNFEVGELWLARDQPQEAYREVTGLAGRRGVRLRWLAAGQTISFGGARIDVLGPGRLKDSGLNNQSMVLRLRYGRHGFLLAADVEQERELRMVDSGLIAPSEVLKVAHHGSRTSSLKPFLRKARPLFGVVSAGADNFYGHPHPEALGRLSQQGVAVLRTDQQGLITITSDGSRLNVDTFRRQSYSPIPRAQSSAPLDLGSLLTPQRKSLGESR
jgi:competence protein ComEC